MLISDTLRFMGAGSVSSPETIELAETAIEKVRSVSTPVSRLTVINSDNKELLRGADIEKHLCGCSKAFVLIATLGPGVDLLIRKTQLQSMREAVAVDAAASACLEEYCDEICAKLAESNSITMRFSPGYGDYPIEVQPQLLAFCGAEKIGLTCSGYMMIPTKSVSAIIGIKDENYEELNR